jgi:hypothetical protein
MWCSQDNFRRVAALASDDGDAVLFVRVRTENLRGEQKGTYISMVQLNSGRGSTEWSGKYPRDRHSTFSGFL